MKRILLIIGFACNALCVLAAFNGIDPAILINGKSWTYVDNYNHRDDNDNCLITILSDTIVNGTQCKIVHKQCISNGDDIDTNYVLSESNGVVSLYDEKTGIFTPILDMNLSQGGKFFDLTVSYVDYIVVNNTPLKRITFDKSICEQPLMWVEGVGANYYDYINLNDDNLMFNQVAMNGSVIADNDAYYSISNDISSGCNLIDENRIWEYATVKKETDRTSYTLNRYKFEGTSICNGREYNNLILSDHTYWDIDNVTNSVSEPIVIADNKLIAQLREQDGYVYMSCNNQTVNYCPYPYNNIYGIDSELIKDVLLYAPVSLAEQTVNLYLGSSDYGNFITPSYFREISDVYESKMGLLRTYSICNVPTPVETGNNQEDGQSDMSLTINAKYIEGIGNIGYGNMTNIICDYADSDNEAATVECFNNLYDKDGNVLYNGSNFSVPDTNSVDVIYENDSSCETAPIYDLMGRRITSPTKGQIYIQNGKKLVGQCSK